MKNLLFSTVLAIILLGCSGLRQMEKRPMLQTNPATLTLEGDNNTPSMVDVEYSMDIPSKYMTKGGQLIYQPQFSNGNEKLNLTPVVISGKRAARREARLIKRGKELPISNAIRLIGDKEPASLKYETSVEVQKWMPNSDLVGWSIFSDRKGKQTVIQKQTLASGIKMPKPKVITKPKPRYENRDIINKEEMVSTLYFMMNMSSYDVSLNSNKLHIDSTINLLMAIEKDPMLQLSRIEIIGSASPDGTAQINTSLAKKRGEAVAKMLEDKCNVSPALISVTSLGANWVGLIDAVKKSSMSSLQKNKIIEIATSNGSDALKSYKLRRLPSFNNLKISILPHLRSATCKIFYTKTTIDRVEVY